MAKLAVATVVLVALFLAVAEVSCFRTIVTTTIDEVEQRGRGESQEQRCRQQVQQRYGSLGSCRNYMEPSGSPTELDMYVNQQRQRGQQEAEQQQCCQALRELGDCSCHAIQQIVEEQIRRFQQRQGEQGRQWGEQGQGRQEQEQQQQQQVQHILRKARELPRECSLRQQCQIETPSFYYY